MNRVVGDETPGCTREFHILGKKIIKIGPSQLFCFGRVGDCDGNTYFDFAETTGGQN